MALRKWACILATLFSYSLYSQVWVEGILQPSNSKTHSFYGDASYRDFTDVGDFKIVIRPSYRYKHNRWEYHGGLGWFYTYTAITEVHEFRPFLGVMYKLGNAQFYFRTEMRNFYDFQIDFADEWNYRNIRFRLMLQSKYNFNSKWYMNYGLEPMAYPDRTFVQARTILGGGYRINQHFSTEVIGFLEWTFTDDFRYTYTNQEVLRLRLVYTPN